MASRDDRLGRDLREDRHKPTGYWTHWTAAGVFELKSDTQAGMRVYLLSFRGRPIAPYFDIGTAIDRVLDGSLDGELGIPGKTSGLPSHLSQWNNLK